MGMDKKHEIPILRNLVLHADSPYPDMDVMVGKAYRVTDKKDLGRDLYAIKGSGTHPFRLDIIKEVMEVKCEHLIRPVGFEVVEWPGSGAYSPCIVFQKPSGHRFSEDDHKVFERWSEDDIVKKVILPIYDVLEQLSAARMHHSGICLSNLYYSSFKEESLVLTSPILSCPNVMLNPSYLMLPQAMCHPYGRGRGSIQEDLFALGILIVTFLLGRNPARLYESEDEFTSVRAMAGSYHACVKHLRLNMAMGELLRGLLNDDKDQWNLDDLGLWIRGRRRGVGDYTNIQKAIRPFNFQGKNYDTAKALAFAMDHDWEHAFSIISDGRLDVWLRHYLLDKSKVEAVKAAKEANISYKKQDTLVARILIALDRHGPIRFRNFKSMFDGVGQLLAYYHDNMDTKQAFVDIIVSNLIFYWFKSQTKETADLIHLETVYRKIPNALKATEYGFGLERVIYDLNPGWPCLSPLFEEDYVPDLYHVLLALDRLCKHRGESVQVLIDRHIAAFVVARHHSYTRVVTTTLMFLTMDDPLIRSYAQIKVLAALQSAVASNVPLYHLCQTAVRFLMPTIDQFHNRKKRKEFTAFLERVAKKGSLQDLLTAVRKCYDVIQPDQEGFRHAVREYAKVTHNLAVIQEAIKERHIASKEGGARLASIISGMLCLFGMVVIFFITFFIQ